MTGLTHVYTLECNYNMGRKVNRLAHPHAPPGSDQHRSLSPQPALKCLSPKYTPDSWCAVGKALAVSALDVLGFNPCSRLGAPGKEAKIGMVRVRAAATAWLRTKERSAKEAARRAAAGGGRKGGGSDEDGSDGGGSDGGGGGSDGGDEGPSAARVSRLASVLASKMAGVEVPSAMSENEPRVGNEAEGGLSQRAPPFWVSVSGTPLLRGGFSLRTEPAGRLATGTHVQVLETRRMLDGTVRAAVTLAGRAGETQGWLTLVMRDGCANATYISPQPPLELPQGRSEDGEQAAEPVAAASAAGGAFFVF